MLERFHGKPGCLFVTAPDVVGDAASTLARWPFWSRLIRGLGHAPAFVAQDGITPARVPWAELGALFIGGSTQLQGKRRGAEPRRDRARERDLVALGARQRQAPIRARAQGGMPVDRRHGFSRFPDTNIPLADQWRAEIAAQPELEL
jgi:hypothetical protein